LNKKILRLAIPNILSNLSIPLLSSVDTAVVGHLTEVYFLGAIAIGSMIFNFVYWGFGFLRMGTTGMTAQALGKGDAKEISLVFFRALSVALIGALFIIIVQMPIEALSFYLVTASDKVEFYARSYFEIRIWAAPATLCLYAFQGWFLGMQNAKYPLYIMVFTNVLNIIFNLLFVYQFDMKSDGVALGTVIAQYSGLFLSIYMIMKKYRDKLVKISLEELVHFESLKKFFSVNFDIFIRTLSLIFTFSYFTVISAEFGDVLLAANTILLQLWMILAYGVDGFAFAAESLVGKYIGARNRVKLKEAIKYSFIWGVGIGALFSLIYLVFKVPVLNLFTNNREVIAAALVYYLWTIAAPVINSIAFIWDGIFIGATATKAMRNSMLLATLIVYLPAFHLTKDVLGNHAVWFALFLFMLARDISLTILSRKHIFIK